MPEVLIADPHDGAALFDELRRRIGGLLSGEGRSLLGITGSPGAGKSTLAEWVLRQVLPAAATAWVPMDGFHLADGELDRIGRRAAKGAIDTFDAYGYLATLRRIRAERGHIVYAPEFDRAIEQPIAGGNPVHPGARLIVTEGNYLLDSAEPWPAVRAELTAVWFCDVPDSLRRERLIARHVRYGKTPEEAGAWVDKVDEPNSRRVAATRDSADLIIPTQRFGAHT